MRSATELSRLRVAAGSCTLQHAGGSIGSRRRGAVASRAVARVALANKNEIRLGEVNE
jgi:hypothetical protein